MSIFSNISLADKKIYSCKDQNGDMVFTDSPENDPNCINPKEKKLSPITIAPGITSSSSINNLKSSKTTGVEQNTNYIIAFTQPTSGATINRCGGALDVNFNLQPSLVSGDQIEIYLDGAKYTDTTSTTTNIANLERGSHNLEVKIVREGNIISSQGVSFQFLRNCAPRATTGG